MLTLEKSCACKIFNDRERAITLCVNRYDEETKTAFLDLYAKVDPSLSPEETLDPETLPNPLREGLESKTQSGDEIPF